MNRPPLRYHGGKWRIAPRLIEMFPPHKIYTEAFGGGAGVLLRKDRAKLEVYNDKDAEMVNFFRVLRSDPDTLAAAIEATPFARDEFEGAYEDSDDPIECARRTAVKSHMGFGSSGIHRPTGFRGAGMRAGTLPVHTWATLPAAIRATAERMRGVVIENMTALDFLRKYDAPEALHYIDPPYMAETRDAGRDYKYELSLQDHADLLECAKSLKGAVLISGYANDLYDASLSSWRRTEIKTNCDGNTGDRARTEIVWSSKEANSLFSLESAR